MKIVLDTNVIIAAFATRGLCHDLFEHCLLNHPLVLSEAILSEVESQLSKKIRLPVSVIHDILLYLRETAEIVSPLEVHENVCRDADDLKILGTASSGKAKYIVTGDKDLLVIKKYKGIQMVTPRDFWGILQKG